MLPAGSGFGTKQDRPVPFAAVDAAELWKQRVPRHYQRRVLDARVAFRRITDPRRRLPDFLIVGAQRSGTSSMYKWLEAHPSVGASLRKETEYFSYRHDRGEAWYRGHFPSRWQRMATKARGRDLVAFEATAYYLFHPHAASRAHALMPKAKIVVLLRNPVDRAWSHYHHMVRYGQEPLPFEEAVAQERERLAGEVARMLEDPSYVSWPHQRWSYVSRGIYADQLPAWLDRFGEDRVLILRSEDVYEKPDDAYGEVLSFVGLPEHSLDRFGNASRAGNEGPGKSPPPMPAGVRSQLAETFAPHNRRLDHLLHRDFAWD